MFIPLWTVVSFVIILIWSIALNFRRAKQISALSYSFINVSNTSINMLNSIKEERHDHEGEIDLVPLIITESIQELNQKIDFLLELQIKAGVTHNPDLDGAKALGIV